MKKILLSHKNLEDKTQIPLVKSNEKLMAPLILVVFLIAILFSFAIGFFLGKSLNQTKAPLPSPVTQVSPTATLIPTATPDPTADWKTYSNDKLSFKYPPSWTIKANEIIASDPNIVINIATSDSILMNECMKLDKTEKRNNLIIKKFSRVTTGEMCLTDNPNPREIWIVPSESSYSPGISYSYSASSNPQAEELFYLILSTFKFTE
jgi:hypothetical protein